MSIDIKIILLVTLMVIVSLSTLGVSSFVQWWVEQSKVEIYLFMRGKYPEEIENYRLPIEVGDVYYHRDLNELYIVYWFAKKNNHNFAGVRYIIFPRIEIEIMK